MTNALTAALPKQARVLDAQGFVERLADEMARSERYGRPFTLLLLQAPPQLALERGPWVVKSVVRLARGLVRACDLVGLFEDRGMLAMLLPETEATGAQAVVARLKARLPAVDSSWAARLATYPEHRDVIAYFFAKAQQHVEDPGG